MPEGKTVEGIFAGIAGRYDLANRLLSLGIDRGWRRRLVRRVAETEPKEVADLATGSGDVAFALAKALPPETRVTGYDFCQPMLDQAIGKGPQMIKGDSRKIPDFLQGDCLNMPLPDHSVDAITLAFGLRNLEDRARGLKEMRRILRPGGWLFVLEFSQPHPVLRPFYYFYLKTLLPLLAGWVTGKPEAYRYLAESIEAFPTRFRLNEEFEAAGFAPVRAEGLTGGIVALHSAQNPPTPEA